MRSVSPSSRSYICSPVGFRYLRWLARKRPPWQNKCFSISHVICSSDLDHQGELPCPYSKWCICWLYFIGCCHGREPKSQLSFPLKHPRIYTIHRTLSQLMNCLLTPVQPSLCRQSLWFLMRHRQQCRHKKLNTLQTFRLLPNGYEVKTWAFDRPGMINCSNRPF